MDGERVVAEAFAGPAVYGVPEVVAITDEAYRGRGFALVVRARTILACDQRGWRTWCNTAGTNAASAGLARELGYRTERRYRVQGWSRSSAP